MERLLFITFMFFMMLSNINSQNSNRHFFHTLSTKASPDRIWQIWTDVNNWKQWDAGLQEATMADSFQLGAKGQIISLEGRKSTFKVVAYDEKKSYTFKTNLPLGGLYVKRYLTIEEDITHFTHEVWFKGASAKIFAKAFGPKFKLMLPEVMDKIKSIAEQK